MAPTDDRTPEEPPPHKGWEWRRCGARVEGDTWERWWRRGVTTWLVTGPGQHNPRFQNSWEGATWWCAPATEDLQPMAWPEYPTYTWVLREEFYGHCAAGGSWEELGVDKQWRPREVWRSAEFGRLRPVDEDGRPCMLRRVRLEEVDDG